VLPLAPGETDSQAFPVRGGGPARGSWVVAEPGFPPYAVDRSPCHSPWNGFPRAGWTGDPAGPDQAFPVRGGGPTYVPMLTIVVDFSPYAGVDLWYFDDWGRL
jgi:hypothetical protein